MNPFAFSHLYCGLQNMLSLQCLPFKIVFKFPSCQPIIVISGTGVISKTQSSPKISFCNTNKCMMCMFQSFLYFPTCCLFPVPWLFWLQHRVKKLCSSFCGSLNHYKIRVFTLYQAFNLISNASVWEYLPYLPHWPPNSLFHVPTVKTSCILIFSQLNTFRKMWLLF